MRKRFYSKSFFDLRIVLKKKGQLVDKGKSIAPGLKYLGTINAQDNWRGNRKTGYELLKTFKARDRVFLQDRRAAKDA